MKIRGKGKEVRKASTYTRVRERPTKRRSVVKSANLKRWLFFGAISATAVAVGMAAPMANAASSQTYFVGFPDWLPIEGVPTLPADAVAIKNAMVAAHDTNPLVGWGTGGVDLQPAWVTWVDGLPSYTVPEWGQTGSHQAANPLYQTAWDAAYEIAYRIAYNNPIGGCFRKAACADQKATAEANSKTANIPKTITVPDYGIVEDGYWTTKTAGQWVSPTDLSGLPLDVRLAYAAYALEHGDLGATAPLMNWTTYLTNVNLIAYGDGAIATGQGYQQFIDSVKNGEYQVGAPLTGPRQIRIVGENGEVTVITVNVSNNPITDLPDPDFPEAPANPPQLEVTPGGVIDATLLSLVYLRNPGRPNGGLYSRFAPAYEKLTGVNPVTPERQDVLPEGVDPEVVAKLLNGDFSDIDDVDQLLDIIDQLEASDGKPLVVTLKADAGWEYDLMSDAPVTANPVAWANSVASSVFLTNLITGLDPTDPETAPAGTVLKAYVVPPGQPDAGSIYVTYAPNQLPLLTPMRLPAQLLSLATGEEIHTPVADALEPALKMLADLGYSDVVRNADGTYSRTLDQMHRYTPFGSVAPLTPEGLLYVPGDFTTLLGKGVGAETTQELVQLATWINSALNPDIELDPEVEKALHLPGDAITAVSKQVGDATSKVLHDVGDPVIAARPDAAKAVSAVAQGALPPKQQQEETAELATPAKADDPKAVEAVKDTPSNNVVTKSPAKGRTPVKTAISNTRQEVKERVSEFRTARKEAAQEMKSKLHHEKKRGAADNAKGNGKDKDSSKDNDNK